MDRQIQVGLDQIISEHIHCDFHIEDTKPLGGGCINSAYRVIGRTRVAGAGVEHSFFVKVNDIQMRLNFQAEHYGLIQLAASSTIRVPQPLCVGAVADRAILVMEYLPLVRADDTDLWRCMGADLARLHLTPIADINAALRRGAVSSAALLPAGRFGGTVANSTLGNRPGFCGTATDWADYFCRHRLQFQFEQARRIHGKRFPAEDQLLARAQTLLDHRPTPALTHGDLWGGNAAFATLNCRPTAASPAPCPAALPVFYDPAPYVADPETDLGLTELFGGFPAAFYDGYRRVRPIDVGYSQRRMIYNLYHVLNHYNLFGGGYLQQAENTIAAILA